jgi:hypothetical protein
VCIFPFFCSEALGDSGDLNLFSLSRVPPTSKPPLTLIRVGVFVAISRIHVARPRHALETPSAASEHCDRPSIARLSHGGLGIEPKRSPISILALAQPRQSSNSCSRMPSSKVGDFPKLDAP